MVETCGKKRRRTSPTAGCPVCSEWTPWSGETKTKMERWRASYWTYTLTVRDDDGDDEDDNDDDDSNENYFHLQMTCRSGASKGNMMSHSIKEHKIGFWLRCSCRSKSCGSYTMSTDIKYLQTGHSAFIFMV